MKEKKSTPDKERPKVQKTGTVKRTEERKTEAEREDYYQERRRQRRIKRQRQVRRRKMMVLGATAVISLVVVFGAVRGIAGFVTSRVGSAE